VNAKLKVRALRLATAVTCMLPRSIGYDVARALGLLLAWLPTARRRTLMSNISAARGEPIGAPGVRRDVKRAFQHAMLNYVDLFRLARPDARAAVQRIVVEDWRPYDEANSRGKGVILVSAHLGNFDMVVQKLPLHGARVIIPVEPVEPPELLLEIRRHRAALGTEIVPVGLDTFKLMSAHVRSGGTAVIVSDRDIQHTGYPVCLFGRPARLPQAAIVLALRTGAPVLGAFGYRHADNRITGRFATMPEFGNAGSAIDGSTRMSFKDALASGMRALTAMIEREIARDPGQWVIQQPVFDADQTTGTARRPILSALFERTHMLKSAAAMLSRRSSVPSR
jgi:lauroyl/myristoyl acyltransferase